MNAFYVSAILSLTVFLAVSFGILAAYTLINAVLATFGRQTRPSESKPQPVLMARNAQAGAD